MRLWQRALHRAGISLAYSEGYTPHPRISLAVPLALGVTSGAELMDVFCNRWVSPQMFITAVGRQLPPGIGILKVFPIPLTLPSLQSQVRHAEYRVEVAAEKGRPDVEVAITSLLSLEHLSWQHQRDTGPRSYDLRALIDDLWLIEWRRDGCNIGMRLRCDSSGSGRPEQVTAALGFAGHPVSMHRTELILEIN